MRQGPIAVATAGGQRAALRGAGGVLRARPGAAAQVQRLLLAGRRRHAGRGRGGDARADLRAGRHRGRHGDPRPRLRLGIAVASGWPSASRGSRILAVSNSAGQRRFIQRQAARARAWTGSRSSPRHQRLRPDGPLRPGRLGRDVRAHAQLPGAAGRASPAGWRPTGALFVHVFCHRDRPYLFEARRQRRLDGAPLLHRRHDALGRPASGVRRRPPRRRTAGWSTARTTSAPRAPGCGGWKPTGPPSSSCSARPTAPPRPSAGISAGGCSSSPAPSCSPTTDGREWMVGHYLLHPGAGS